MKNLANFSQIVDETKSLKHVHAGNMFSASWNSHNLILPLKDKVSNSIKKQLTKSEENSVYTFSLHKKIVVARIMKRCLIGVAQDRKQAGFIESNRQTKASRAAEADLMCIIIQMYSNGNAKLVKNPSDSKL